MKVLAEKMKNNRRLFLSSELYPKSGKHRIDKELNCTDLSKIKDSGKLYIIDDRVYKSEDVNVALPKNDFAEYVLNQVPNFNDLDHSELSNIFAIIRKIMIESGPGN